MKKISFLFCALMVILSVNAAPVALQTGKLSKNHFEKMQISKENDVRKISSGSVYDDEDFSDNMIRYRINESQPNTVEVIGLSGSISSLVIPDSVMYNGVYYTVTTIGNQAFEECTGLTAVTIPENVTTIGSYAFSSCTSLTSVTIPESVTTIGNRAFYYCTGLTAVTIPESVTTISNHAFEECTGLTAVTWNAINCSTPSNYYDRPFDGCSNISSFVFGNQVQKIPDYLCSGLSNLSSVTIPESVTTIGSRAFNGCTGLTAVTWNAINCSTNSDSYYPPFYGCTNISSFVFGNQVQKIPDYLCYELSNLSSATIPESVTTIGSHAFSSCTSLTSVTIPESVTTIGSHAFSSCTSLTAVTIPESVTTIGSYAFSSCTSLTSVTIPESVTTIGDGAFKGCNAFSSLIVPENVDTIGSDAFVGCNNLSLVIWNARNCVSGYWYSHWDSYYDDYIYEWENSINSPFPSSVGTFIFGDHVQQVPNGLCRELNQLTSIALPNTVTKIGEYAFSYCSGLISVTMEEGVQTIGDYAFQSCTNLPQIVIPNSVTKIGDDAFGRCSNLTTATIGNHVDTIGSDAFSSCERLMSIELPTSVSYIGESAFHGCLSMNKAIVHSTAELDPLCMILLNPQIDTIIAPASIFDIDEQHRLNYVCTKRMKYVKANSGELTEDAFVVIRRSASTLETLDVSATTNMTIADEAFCNMYRLTTLGLPQGLDRISYKAVAECVRLQSIDIPAGITEIGDRAFEDCRSLTTITFGGQSGATADVALQTIGNWAFYNNHALQQLTIPAGVTTIGAGAFYGCTYLEDLAMPASLRNVGDNAFALCNHLTKMQVEATLPPQVAARTFFDVNRAIPVYVPDEAVNDYRTTQVWQEFFIRPISQAATGIGEVEQDGQEGTGMLPDGKFMQNGQLFIRKNGRVYDTQGRLIE